MPVRLNRLHLLDVSSRPNNFLQEIAANYVAEAIFRAPMLIGSLKLLGNPTNLVSKLQTGLSDLISMPVEALGKGPSAFMKATAIGMASFARNLTEGALSSVADLSETLARNVGQFGRSNTTTSQDSTSPQSPSSLSTGVKRLGQGVLEGVVDVIAVPVQKAKQEGVFSWGFVKGIGSGLLSAVTKPLSGALDLVSHASSSLVTTSQNLGSSSIQPSSMVTRRSLSVSLHQKWSSLARLSTVLVERYQQLCLLLHEEFVDRLIVPPRLLMHSNKFVSGIPVTPSSDYCVVLLLTTRAVHILDDDHIVCSFPLPALDWVVGTPRSHIQSDSKQSNSLLTVNLLLIDKQQHQHAQLVLSDATRVFSSTRRTQRFLQRIQQLQMIAIGKNIK
jgi:hypothetical protein